MSNTAELKSAFEFGAVKLAAVKIQNKIIFTKIMRGGKKC